MLTDCAISEMDMDLVINKNALVLIRKRVHHCYILSPVKWHTNEAREPVLKYYMKIMSILVSCLANHLPNVRLRRSERLQAKNESVYTALSSSDYGHFSSLPLELKFLIFKYLTVEDLSLLTITSKSMRHLVELYMNCKWAPQFRTVRELKHGFIHSKDEKLYEVEFQKLGLYMKRSTCLYTTKERLKLIQQFLQKCLCRFCVNCLKPTKCTILKCFGIFLHIVIAGWDESECSTAFHFVAECSQVQRYIAIVVQHGPGLFLSQELYIRLCLRHVFIDRCRSKADKAFWIDLILKPHSPDQQARILFLLFGMMYGEIIQWFSLSIETDIEHCERCFGELASALRLLFFYKGWSEHIIISIIDNLICTPDDWCPTNKAILLYQCGEIITVKVLSMYVRNGERRELAEIITSLCLITMHHSQSVSWVINIIHNICEEVDDQNERISLIHEIIDAFKFMIERFYDLAVLDDETSGDIHSVLNAQAAFVKELALLAFNTIRTAY